MAQVPSLLQLCGEKLASEANKHERTRSYILSKIKGLCLPKIKVSYIQNEIRHKECDFLSYILLNLNMRRSTIIIPSMLKCWENYEFKLTVSNKELMYISTLTDLGVDMLELDFPKGEYGLFPFHGGFILKTEDYPAHYMDIVHIFSTCSEEKGLVDTYFGRPTTNVNQLRIFNQYIGKYITDRYWWRDNVREEDEYDFPRSRKSSEEDDYDYDGYVKRRMSSEENEDENIEFPGTELWLQRINERISRRRFVRESIDDFNNIPVLFFLNTKIEVEDLRLITLTQSATINNCGNIDACWYVHHLETGVIGIAVKQKLFFNMMSDLAGLCLLRSNGFRALGNFENRVIFDTHVSSLRNSNSGDNDPFLSIFYPYHDYDCDFNPCSCNTVTEDRINRQNLQLLNEINNLMPLR